MKKKVRYAKRLNRPKNSKIKRDRRGGKIGNKGGGRRKLPETILKEEYQQQLNEKIGKCALLALAFLEDTLKEKKNNKWLRLECSKLIIHKVAPNKSDSPSDDVDKSPNYSQSEFVD